MAGEKAGKNLLLEVADGSGTFTEVGGLRSKSLTINNELIDSTNHGSNEWREILDGAGIRMMTFSGSGIFNNDANLAQMRDACINGSLLTMRIRQDSAPTATYQGTFKCTSFEVAGEYNAEQTYNLTFESSGQVTVS